MTKEEKQLAKIELTKIAKAIVIHQFTKYKPLSSAQPNGIGEVRLKMGGSKATSFGNHIELSSSFGFGSFDTTKIHYRQKEVLEKVLARYNWDTVSICKKNPIMLVMSRYPTEEEILWAKHVFENEGIDKNCGAQSIIIKFNASINITFNQTANGGKEDFITNKLDLVKSFVDENRYHYGCSMTYTDGAKLVSTKVEDVEIYCHYNTLSTLDKKLFTNI